ncbi:hypothetical protein Tco_1028403 [Tanacetum coccineum]|uniref:Reverse transcriptase domain-containing protein n=1 Tax=Tanacetum coccineum TaxID=301880 RepID=A0ABQ5G2A9_9ASTR
MADNRTMAQMLQAPIEGYEDAIVVPPINAIYSKLFNSYGRLIIQSLSRDQRGVDPCGESLLQLKIIDPIFEEIAGELAHIAPIPPRIVEADFDPNDDTSSDDDNFEDIEYVSLEEENDVDQEEKEFDLEDIFQIQDVILREKLLNVHRLISKIESLKDNPIPIVDSDSSITSLSFSDNSLPEFESFSDHTEETRSGNTTTHANYSLPEYDSFLFEIEPDQEGLISIDNPEFESFHFDPTFSRPPPEPPDVEILEPENNNFDVLNNDEPFDQGGGENVVFLNDEEDDSFTFTIRTFLPFVTYPEVTLLSCSRDVKISIFVPQSPFRSGLASHRDGYLISFNVFSKIIEIHD